jgi:GNAT superfamily N-acetyltransferase
MDAFAIDGHAGVVHVRLHTSVEEFNAVAEPLYRRDPVLHTIELTLLAGGIHADDAVLLTTWRDGVAVGAAMQTPPYPLVCTGIPADMVRPVAEALAGARPGLEGVRGIRDMTFAFADAWRGATGRSGRVTVEERLYRLGALVTPESVAGVARQAAANDRGLLVDWVELFFGETFGHRRDDAAGAGFVDAASDKGDQFILWVVDCVPVSMAMLRAPAAGVSRIGPVFTPVDRRGSGYGSAVTAAAADVALRRGATDVVLFADLANPTSNDIYRKIGFESVADSIRIDFVTAD